MDNQEKFKQALADLMNERHLSIPWHHTNVGIRLQKEYMWKFETLFKLLEVPADARKEKYLVAYDTLGFFTNLLLEFSPEVTYQTTANKYEHVHVPAKTWVVDIISLPPKSSELQPKYNGIVVPSYFHDCSPEKIQVLLFYLKKLLRRGGRVVFSVCDRTAQERNHLASVLEELGLETVAIEFEPPLLRTHQTDYPIVRACEVVK